MWISVVDPRNLNCQHCTPGADPCALAHMSQRTPSNFGSKQADAGTKTVTLGTAAHDPTTLYTVCYSDHSTYDPSNFGWKYFDSGVRVKIGDGSVFRMDDQSADRGWFGCARCNTPAAEACVSAFKANYNCEQSASDDNFSGLSAAAGFNCAGMDVRPCFILERYRINISPFLHPCSPFSQGSQQSSDSFLGCCQS